MHKEEYVKKLASDCVHCVTKPCQVGCPLNNDTTGFIALAREGKFHEAYELLSKTTVLSSVCGRICPHEKQCQGMCVKRVSYEEVHIGEIEAFIGDQALENHWIEKPNLPNKKKRVAVVGGGPSGLTCAAFLRRKGYPVTIYERHDYLGGLLYHGIPDFRLPKDLLQRVIDHILCLGIEVKYQETLGKTFSLQDLEKEYDAIFLGIGANISNKMNIPGENKKGVYGGNELLETKEHPDYKGKVVVVSGGGNVAMDVSRTIQRMGAKKVYVVYRRSEKASPAETKEIQDAKEEGIEFLFQNNIIRIVGDDTVNGVELVRTKLVSKEDSSRLVPVNIEGSNYVLSCDYVVMAVGSKPDASIVSSLGVDCDSRGRIIIDESGHTTRDKVFSGGDVAGVKGTVAFAARSGRNAAYAIEKYLNS